jgi:hypothetical protein
VRFVAAGAIRAADSRYSPANSLFARSMAAQRASTHLNGIQQQKTSMRQNECTHMCVWRTKKTMER